MISLSDVPGLGVIVFKDGREVYSQFEGLRNIAENKPMTRESRFRVASVSKMFTVFTIMQLVGEGKINLDADVSEYLGFKLRNPNFPDTPITIRMLASHTSTIRDEKIYSLPPSHSVEEFFQPDSVHFGKEDKNFFQYCNLNYGLLGTIIERVTGERFDTYQKNHILKQLDINADYVVGNLGEREFENLGTLYQKRAAQMDDYKTQPEKDFVLVQNPYARDTEKFYGLENYKVGTNATIFSPQGGLRISFAELSHALQMLMNGGRYRGRQVIKPELVEEMTTPQWIYDEKNPNGDTLGVMFNYCLGLYRIDGGGRARLCKDCEIDFIGHSGEAYGMISGLYFTPRTKNGVVFMVNGTEFEPDENPKSRGRFSNNFIWEENIMNPICRLIRN